MLWILFVIYRSTLSISCRCHFGCKKHLPICFLLLMENTIWFSARHCWRYWKRWRKSRRIYLASPPRYWAHALTFIKKHNILVDIEYGDNSGVIHRAGKIIIFPILTNHWKDLLPFHFCPFPQLWICFALHLQYFFLKFIVLFLQYRIISKLVPLKKSPRIDPLGWNFSSKTRWY